MSDLKKNQIVFYARILPPSGIYDVLELKIRTVEEDWFVGQEKRDKQAFLFLDDAIGKTVFTDRKKALKVAQAAEKRKETINEETYYEEY